MSFTAKSHRGSRLGHRSEKQDIKWEVNKHSSDSFSFPFLLPEGKPNGQMFIPHAKQTKKVCILKVNFCKCLGWIGAYCVGISTPEWCHLYFGVWGAFWVIGSSGIKPSADAQKPLFSLHCLILKKIKRCGYKPDICRKPTDKVKYKKGNFWKKPF